MDLERLSIGELQDVLVRRLKRIVWSLTKEKLIEEIGGLGKEESVLKQFESKTALEEAPAA